MSIMTWIIDRRRVLLLAVALLLAAPAGSCDDNDEPRWKGNPFEWEQAIT